MMKRIFFICIFALWISFLFFFEKHTVIITPDTTHTGIVMTGSSIVKVSSSQLETLLTDTEVKNTLSRIERDRPKYHQDGAVFMNRERLLPKKSDASYYHEWTVVTPGSDDR